MTIHFKAIVYVLILLQRTGGAWPTRKRCTLEAPGVYLRNHEINTMQSWIVGWLVGLLVGKSTVSQ